MENGLEKLGRLMDLAQEIADLAPACFPLVATAPESVLHCMNGGGTLLEPAPFRAGW